MPHLGRAHPSLPRKREREPTAIGDASVYRHSPGPQPGMDAGRFLDHPWDMITPSWPESRHVRS